MKLLKDIIIRRMEVAKDYELNNDNLKSIWTFYQIYKICANILGVEDSNIKKKDSLIKNLMNNEDNTNSLLRIKQYISQDNIKIEMVLNSIKNNEAIEEVYEDFYPVDIIGINLDER